MKKPIDIGDNRTGVARSPLDAKATAEGAAEGVPAARLAEAELLAARLDYSKEAGPVGTMPPPLSIKGVAKATVQALKGRSPSVFLDLLGERLAFERTGTRLYDALLCKLEAASIHPGGPTRADLERIRDEELAHAGLVKKALEKLGADPTVVTPCADVSAVASSGLLAVCTDPRSTLTESLKAVQIAELADNDAWLVLADLASRLGLDDLAAEFRQALAEEANHLALVRSWASTALAGQLGVEGEPRSEGPRPPAA